RVAADDQFGKHFPIRVAEMVAEEELKGRLADGHGRAGELLLLTQEQEIRTKLVFGKRGRVAVEMIGQSADVTDIFLFGGRFEIFEFDKLAKTDKRRSVNIHRRERMPSCD